MRRRIRVRDVLLVLPLDVIEAAFRGAQVAARRRRADYRRLGSLTYNRQQAARLYRQAQERDGPWV